MQTTGTIIELNGETASVAFKRTKACGSCDACMRMGSDESLIEIQNTLGAKVGDEVEIMLHGKNLMQASLIMYGAPACALVAGVFAGSFINDIAAAAIGLGLAALTYVIIHMLEPKIQRMRQFKPRMLNIAARKEENDV